MAAQLLINQTGLPAGVVNQARSDGLRTGALVTLTSAGQGSSHNFELLWVPDDDGIAVQTFQKINSTTATFSPDPSSIGGTYRIKLTVVQDTGVSEVIRCFSILTVGGIRIPALNEQASDLATLTSGPSLVQESEFNEPSAGRFASGNYAGWYSAYSDLVKKVETLSGGGGAVPWGSLYEVDFTALPSQTIGAAGAYTIDGLTWWAKGALSGLPFGGTMASRLENGTGLIIQNVGSSGIVLNAGDVPLVFRHLFLPFSNIPGFNAEAPFLLRYRIIRDNGGVFGGVVSTTNDGNDLTTGQRKYDHFHGFPYDGYNPQHKRGLNGASASNQTNYLGSFATGERVMGITQDFTGRTMETSDPTPWSGSFAPIGPLLGHNSTQPLLAVGPRPNPGFCLVQVSNGVTGSRGILTHLSISQPKV